MSRKEVRRERRRNEGAMDEAFAALERGEGILAMRIARRAREAGSMNIRILLDHARIARACRQHEEAEQSLRAVIAMAGNCKEAYQSLAELQADRGKWVQAVRLMMRAIELDPADENAQALLRTWHEQLPAEAREVVPTIEDPIEPPSPRIAERDPAALHEELVERGFALLRDLCTEQECALLRAAFASGDGFDREIRLSGTDAEGEALTGCRARWSLSTLPPFIAELRRALYPLAAELSNRTRALLGDKKTLPLTHGGWLRHRGGPGRSAARLLAFAPGEVMPAERTEARAAFPLRLLVDLGPGGKADSLAMIDARPGRKVRKVQARTGPGDALLLCCRDRPQAVGGVYGLQLVQWSCGPFTEERVLLDVPFDDD